MSNADRQYLDALSENGSFGDVVSFAYELIERLERIEPATEEIP
jgi:hypothetical protein